MCRPASAWCAASDGLIPWLRRVAVRPSIICRKRGLRRRPDQRFELRIERPGQDADTLARNLLLRGHVVRGIAAGRQNEARVTQRAAPQRGQRSAFWPGCSSDGSQGIRGSMPVILR